MSNTPEELKREFAREHCSYLGAEIESWKKPIEDGFVSDLNALLDKLMPTEEEIIEAALRHTTHKSLLPAHRGLMKDAFIIGAKWFRSRMKGGEK